jgi:cytochrome c553
MNTLYAALLAALLAALCLPSAPAHAQDIAKGRARAQAACAMCHGQNGIATLPNAANLAGQPAVYVEEQLLAYRSGKRPSEMMSLIAKGLSDDDVRNLAAWYAAIKVTVQVPE